MIHWKKEGQRVCQGISIYHPRDTSSIGGCLRIGNHLWRLRYSKLTKRWHAGHDKVVPGALEAWEAKHGIKHE